MMHDAKYMMLLIGLGNPEGKHKKNRHNAGFIVIDEIKKLWNFPDFQFNKKFNAEISEENHLPVMPEQSDGGRGKLKAISYKLLLAKPQTFINNSGDAVQKIMSFYKLTPQDIIIIHDDLDIEIGKYKLSANTHSVGHKGVEDIIEKLGTQEFKRIRIGVETEGGRQNRKIPGESYVLQNFTEEEYKKVTKLTKEISNELV